jgi:hypothetical protein
MRNRGLLTAALATILAQAVTSAQPDDDVVVTGLDRKPPPLPPSRKREPRVLIEPLPRARYEPKPQPLSEGAARQVEQAQAKRARRATKIAAATEKGE